MNDQSTENKQNILQNEVLTVSEVATFLRVSRATVWRWCHHGTIPALRVGRSWRIYRDDLLYALGRSQSSSLPSVPSCSTRKNADIAQASPIIVLEEKEIIDCSKDDADDDLGSNKSQV